MLNLINGQKKVTRDALSYVAEITRARSILYSEEESKGKNSPERQLDNSMSYASVQSVDTETLSRTRQEKLMKLIAKTEIPK